MDIMSKLSSGSSKTKKLLSFVYFLVKEDIFGMKPVPLILKVIEKLVLLEYSGLTNNISYRTSKDSANLLKSLIEVYLKEKSSRTLEQITVILRDEIFGRE